MFGTEHVSESSSGLVFDDNDSDADDTVASDAPLVHHQPQRDRHPPPMRYVHYYTH